MWNTNEARNAIAKPIRNPAHIHLCFTDLMMPRPDAKAILHSQRPKRRQQPSLL